MRLYCCACFFGVLLGMAGQAAFTAVLLLSENIAVTSGQQFMSCVLFLVLSVIFAWRMPKPGKYE